MSNFKVGQKVEYVSYGVACSATIVRIGNSGILFLDNVRWMFPESCKGVEA